MARTNPASTNLWHLLHALPDRLHRLARLGIGAAGPAQHLAEGGTAGEEQAGQAPDC